MITYAHDVAPHLARALELRALRNSRWLALHEHDGRAKVWHFALVGLILFWGLVAYGISSLAP
jgi:hypothetical protein